MQGHRLVVVCDAHLGAGPPATESGFLDFLDAVPSLGDALLVNGDLFDFWFAWRRVIPRAGFPVAAALGRLRRRMPVIMTGGNHDRWGDDFWRADLGIEFHPLEARFRFAEREVLAIHGDGIADRNWSARGLQRLTRHPAAVKLFGALHPSLGFRLVDMMNRRMGNTVTDPAALAAASQRQQLWAEARLLAEPALGLLVMGHTHRPALSEPSPGRRYVNPGAWFDGGRYAICSDRGVELRQFQGAGSGEPGAGGKP
ncbi:MAG: UDP-2,3-diacylglucosamine diphosphatase [Gemmatimonadales bacterium]